MAPHANFHQLISIEKLIVSVCRYHMSYIYADIICLISMQIYSLFFFYTMVGVVCITRLLSTTWPRFKSFTLLYADRECYPDASTTSNSNESNVKLLTTAAMVDNLAEKVDECLLNRDR